MSSISKTWRKLSDPEYRKAFVASQINIGIPFQIRALAKARGWSQEQVADRCGMSQPRISELMRPGRAKPNLGTLLRLAAGFDCGLLVKFVRFSELARWSDEFDPEQFDAQAFGNDSIAERQAPAPSPQHTRLFYRTSSSARNEMFSQSRDNLVAFTPPEAAGSTKHGRDRSVETEWGTLDVTARAS